MNDATTVRCLRGPEQGMGGEGWFGVQALGSGDPRSVGDYRLVSRLGAGGMGQVYLGMSPGGRRVAIKVVHPELVRQPEFRSRFQREVLAARLVSGAYTAPVIDANSHAPTPWLVTSYIPGPSLQQAVKDQGPLPAATVLALAAALAEALNSIHDAGLVHRDLKPSNVLLAEDGPRVIDFGIARLNEVSRITETGASLGSPGFMSPEQVNGTETTRASDVFSLGAVLAYAATGANPFGEGPVHALNFRVVYNEPDLEAVTCPSLRGLIADCLAKEPEKRPTPKDILVRAGFEGGLTTLLGSDVWLPAVRSVQLSDEAAAFADTVTGDAANGPLRVPAAPVALAPVPTVPTPRRGPTRRTLLLSGLAAVAATGIPAGLYLSREKDSLPSPVGAWPLHQHSGNITPDTAGRHNGVATRVQWADSAAVFDGAHSQIVTRGPVLTDLPGSGFTVSAHVLLKHRTELFATAVSQSSGGVIAFYLQYSSVDDRWAFAAQGGRSLSLRHPRIGKWTHLVGVRSGDQLLLYVDGEKQTRAISEEPIRPTVAGDSLFIGRALNGDLPWDWFPGSIKYVQVFDQALSAAQVRALSG